jgi:hypothetical protein
MTDPRTTKAERRCLKHLMETLGIKAYLFSLEDGGAQFRLTLEYAICSGWYSGSVVLDKADLGRCEDDPAARERLLERLRTELPQCPVTEE